MWYVFYTITHYTCALDSAQLSFKEKQRYVLLRDHLNFVEDLREFLLFTLTTQWIIVFSVIYYSVEILVIY